MIIGLITFYALNKWAPSKSSNFDNKETAEDISTIKEEQVRFDVLLQSLEYDVVKINTHSHSVGINSEYFWINNNYPNNEVLLQRLTTFKLKSRKGNYKNDKVNFDIIKIKLTDGRQKEIYFDISSFFDRSVHPVLDSDTFMTSVLAKLY